MVKKKDLACINGQIKENLWDIGKMVFRMVMDKYLWRKK